MFRSVILNTVYLIGRVVGFVQGCIYALLYRFGLISGKRLNAICGEKIVEE